MHHLEVLVEPHEVLLEEAVLHAWVSLRHVYPQVEDAGLTFLPPVVGVTRFAEEGCLQVLLHVSDYRLLLHEVAVVPLLIGILLLFELAPVLQQLIEELDGEHVYVLQLLELGYVHMRPIGDV